MNSESGAAAKSLQVDNPQRRPGAGPADEVLPPYIGVTLAEVSLIQTAASAAAARDALLAADALGFDTESKPTFRKGEVSTGPHLVQLSTDHHVYLFPVGRGEPLPLLAEVLAAPGILKVGFGLRDDLKRLHIKYGIRTENVLDLAVALRKERRLDIGAKSAVAQFFGQRLQKSKKTSTTNWSLPKLTDAQILYAANDAQVALRVYRKWLALRAGAAAAVQPEAQP
jgi:RNA polymerase sigma factor for flagellar operon FliA